MMNRSKRVVDQFFYRRATRPHFHYENGVVYRATNQPLHHRSKTIPGCSSLTSQIITPLTYMSTSGCFNLSKTTYERAQCYASYKGINRLRDDNQININALKPASISSSQLHKIILTCGAKPCPPLKISRVTLTIRLDT